MRKLFTKYIIKPIIKMIDRYTNRRGAFIFGVMITVAFGYYVIPEANARYDAIMEIINPEVVVTNERIDYVQPAEPQPEKLERYYQEELNKLTPKYEEAAETAARKAAIERVQADLEAEKETLRETELFL
jgi:hypothetical protein